MSQGALRLTAKSHRPPLAERLRPRVWEDFEGASELDQNVLRQVKEGRGRIPSLILWGPPGVGKTTLARLVGASCKANFVEFSAVLSGVKEVREVVDEAKRSSVQTILFVDEIHRFNKAQQDAFLPHVESGVISLIGATTENPSFSLTGALLSRCKVICLKDLSKPSLRKILERGERELDITLTDEAKEIFIQSSLGDGRKLLNLLEALAETLSGEGQNTRGSIQKEQVLEFLKDAKTIFYDRAGEEHYNNVSAFIKSLRASDPDAALFWGFRMLQAGEDPRFIIRRMMIFASEDIGNADPRALQVAVATSEAYEKLGLPEGRIPIAQCITYLASAPKSNRSYVAMNLAIEAVKANPKASVPLHLRNAPTKLMKEMGYGRDYKYPHDYVGAVVEGASNLPPELDGAKFYEPTERGYEKIIGERLRQKW